MSTKIADSYKEVQNYVGGTFTKHHGDFLDVYSPTDGQKISKVPL